MGFAALSPSYDSKIPYSAAFDSVLNVRFPLIARDAHRNSHAAADAQRREALLGVTLLHFVEQGHQNARARCADRMTERDRAAIDVDPVGVPAEVAVDRAGLRRERLVGLDEVEILGRPPGFLQRQ